MFFLLFQNTLRGFCKKPISLQTQKPLVFLKASEIKYSADGKDTDAARIQHPQLLNAGVEVRSRGDMLLSSNEYSHDDSFKSSLLKELRNSIILHSTKCFMT